MPIENPTVAWPEDESPYLTIATITAASQDPWTLDKISAIDEGLSFSPWHAFGGSSATRFRQPRP
jgi:hypothetical protein